jgi:hypothetical protein
VDHVLPSRVLDIGTSAIPHIRLRITNEDEKGKYAALSYCWGGYTGLMLKQHNMADFQHSIDEISMPQTYKDAILPLPASRHTIPLDRRTVHTSGQ